MADLSDYERLGDVDAPFELTKQQERAQREAERSREDRCQVPALTWEAYLAGSPCPGCGRPYRDEERWEFKGTMHFSEEERERYDAEEARFREAHPDCHAGRHSVSGSLTTHCCRCCPMPPLSPRQREEIGRILSRPTPPHELMRWRLRLYCGHVIETRSHANNRTVRSAFSGHRSCDECGLDPATIIDGEALGLIAEAPVQKPAGRAVQARERLGPRKPTRSELEARVKSLEAEVERLRDLRPI